jgi:hypothetical protein
MVRAMAFAYDAHRIHTDGVRGGGTEKGSAMTAMPPNDRFDRFDRFSKLVPRFDHLKWKMAAAGILVGLISGFLVVLYRLGIEYGTDTARWIYARIRETPWLVAPWAVAAIAAALAIAWMVKKEPMAGGSGSAVGTGGMHTKLQAAAKAGAAGIDTFLFNGRSGDVVRALAQGRLHGTRLHAGRSRIAARKYWLRHAPVEPGAIMVDAGAARALAELHQAGVADARRVLLRLALLGEVVQEGEQGRRRQRFLPRKRPLRPQ